MPLLPSTTKPLEARQIWAVATASATASASDCYAYRIHAGGSIVINQTLTIPLLQDAVLRPYCYSDDQDNATSTRPVLDNAILDVRDPYFASTSPVLFVLAICLTIAWVLLMMLLITPRTFYHGAPGYAVGQMRTGNSGGNFPIVGVGNRPWFQKVATLTVAVSLLIATVRTFDVAADQYNAGYQDSILLTITTLDGTEVRIIRFISTLFEWLAQAQTSLRLFQRHREKVVIKWVALSLICLEMIFSILNNFTKFGTINEDVTVMKPRRFANAIPALQYLFEMALSLMYAAVVLYYSLTKRRFAYYHPKMKNISLVATLSILAVAVPVVFFVLDIAVTNVFSWGDYVRWVGAAAASVIVWEWVERIEALERDERKDGILGREIFEGDEMLDDSTGPEGSYRGGKKRKFEKVDSNTSTIVASSRDSSTGGSSSLKRRSGTRRSRFPRLDRTLLARIAALRGAKKAQEKPGFEHNEIELRPAPPVARRRHRRNASDAVADAITTTQPPRVTPSPISRSDCTSASTVYRVIHHPISPTSTPGISETLHPQGNAMNVSSPSPDTTKGKKRSSDLVAQRSLNVANLNPFRRQRPAHTPVALETDSPSSSPPPPPNNEETVAEKEADKSNRSGFLSRFRRNPSDDRQLPPLVIPWRGDEEGGSAKPQDVDLESGLGRPDEFHASLAEMYAEQENEREEQFPRRITLPSSSRASPVISEFSRRNGGRSTSRTHDTPSYDQRPP